MANIAYKSEYYGVVGLGDSLYHHGIKGQKWGIRRFQNEDGSLTEAGKARYKTAERDIAKEEYKSALKRKSENKASSSEVREAFDRYVAAKKYTDEKMAADKNRKNLSLEIEARREAITAKRNERLQDDKEKAIASGDSKKILKYAPELSTAELNDAVNRAQKINQLKQMAAPDKKVSTLKRFTEAGNEFVGAVNTAKKIKEIFDKKPDEPTKTEADKQYEKNKFAAALAAANDARKNTDGTIGEKEKAAKTAFYAWANGDKPVKKKGPLEKGIFAKKGSESSSDESPADARTRKRYDSIMSQVAWAADSKDRDTMRQGNSVLRQVAWAAAQKQKDDKSSSRSSFMASKKPNTASSDLAAEDMLRRNSSAIDEYFKKKKR